LSLAQELKKSSPECEIIYIGHKGDNFDRLNLPKHNFDFLAFVNAGKFRRYHNESFVSHLIDLKTILLNIRDGFRFIKSIGSAYKILSRTRAQVLFAKGGFVSVPVGIAAKIKGIPIVTHDSDTVGGLANRIVGRWARVKATGMPVEFYKPGKARLEYVGIPLGENIQHVSLAQQELFKNQLKIPPTSQVLLVAGGGLGSNSINKLIIKSAPTLLSSNLSLHLIHITGQDHLDAVTSAYNEALDKAQLKRVICRGFTPDFYAFSGAADLIISRAGATAIAEFALQGKACIIIPSPFLTGGHQLKNADVLSKNDAAVIMDEHTQPDELIGVVNQLLGNEHRRWELSKNLHKMAKPGAAKQLAQLILNEVS
jgi:UDP-N-acetylglucosamine--N-acetylmuramyl-(pentapeptide) pyrophosphoryl-undecaprenol N-acetylglucosamine transferase